VVLLHDVVPRFSIHNVFLMKEEMDATRWGDKLAALAADWAVPDVIERSATYQRLQRKTARGLGKAWARLAVVFAAVIAWVVALLRRVGVVKPESAEHAAARARAEALAEAARAAAAAAASGGSSSSNSSDQVVPVYAPGKLYFVDRRDPPKEEAERLRQEQKAAREAAKKALEERRKKLSGPGSSSSSGLRRRLKPSSSSDAGAASSSAAAATADSEDDDVHRVIEQARHADHTDDDDLPDVDFYPGSTFSMIEGAPGERFRRIVLRDTCLSDHLTGGMLQGCRQLLAGARREAGGGAATPSGGRGGSRPGERLKAFFAARR
jgi:hypothetical protein